MGVPQNATWKMVPVASLHEDPTNARAHGEANRRAVRSSLAEFGQVETLVVTPEGRVLGGNCRLGELRALGVEEVMVAEVALGGHDATRLCLVLNRTAELATWDEDNLEALLRDLDAEDAADGLGWDEGELEGILKDEGEAQEGDDTDETFVADINLTDTPESKTGEVYSLGPHRLYCGSCKDDLGVLFKGETIDLAFTSPPYASQRKYDPDSEFEPIAPDVYSTWFEGVQSNISKHLATTGSWLLNIKAHHHEKALSLYVMDLVIDHVRLWGWTLVDDYRWLRSGVPGSPAKWGHFKNGHEPVFHFSRGDFKFRPDAVSFESEGAFEYSYETNISPVGKRNRHTTAPATGKGQSYPNNVLDLKTTGNTTGHPAPFPVSLPSFFIKAYTDEGDVVFDPFLGSGTTLIAADGLGRVCYGCEVSPSYCDLIRRRWHAWAKDKGLDVGDGLPPRPDATDVATEGS